MECPYLLDIKMRHTTNRCIEFLHRSSTGKEICRTMKIKSQAGRSSSKICLNKHTVSTQLIEIQPFYNAQFNSKKNGQGESVGILKRRNILHDSCFDQVHKHLNQACSFALAKKIKKKLKEMNNRKTI